MTDQHPGKGTTPAWPGQVAKERRSLPRELHVLRFDLCVASRRAGRRWRRGRFSARSGLRRLAARGQDRARHRRAPRDRRQAPQRLAPAQPPLQVLFDELVDEVLLKIAHECSAPCSRILRASFPRRRASSRASRALSPRMFTIAGPNTSQRAHLLVYPSLLNTAGGYDVSGPRITPQPPARRRPRGETGPSKLSAGRGLRAAPPFALAGAATVMFR